MAGQFEAFRQLVRTLEHVRHLGSDRNTGFATNLLTDLTRPGGILFHLNGQIPIGGPGAHPQDIIDLFLAVGVPVNAAEGSHAFEDVVKGREYMRRLIHHARAYVDVLRRRRPSALLGATSGSARVPR